MRNATADSVTDPATVPSIMPASAPLLIPNGEEEGNSAKIRKLEHLLKNM